MKSIVPALILLAAATPAFAASSPFDGTWKLDVQKSKFTGDSLSYTKTPTGYKYSDGGSMTYDFAVDGKDYSTAIPGRTVSWTKTAKGYDVVFKNKGQIMTEAHRALSSDGAKMTSTYVEHRPDGTMAKDSDVYTRASSGEGLAGEWKSVKAQVASDSLMISTPTPGHFKLQEPSYKVVVAGALDGSPAMATGPTVPPGAYGVYKAVSPTLWSYQVVLKGGKVINQGEIAASADGKTITDTSWTPGKRSEAAVSVYDKV